MNVPYLQSDGTPAISTPVLTSNSDKTIFSSTITDIGYWDPDNDGTYEPYGTVKWGPEDCGTMFTVFLDINSDCTGDTISIDGYLTSTGDARDDVGVLYNVLFYKSFVFKVGYKPGDVNGDSLVDMDDMTALINYLMNNQGLNAYQLVGADLNDDGQVDMDDLSLLINYLTNYPYLSPDELEDILNGSTPMS